MANKMSGKKRSASEKEVADANTRSSESEKAETKTRTSEKELKSEKSEKTVKSSTRDERPSKAAAPRRETRSTTASAKKSSGGLRNSPFVRFVRESYHELRYKVTWPTFIEARNMTFAVIAISLVIGLFLGLLDAGLFKLFQLVTGK